MSERSKSKSKTKTQVVKPEDLEKELSALKGLQRLVVVRYSVYLGRRHLQSLKMRECAPELQRLRKISVEINKLFEEAESTGKLDVKKLKGLKEAYKKAREEYHKKAKPYDERIKPLTKQIKHLDILIMNNPTIKPNLKVVVTVDEVPEELRVTQGGK